MILRVTDYLFRDFEEDWDDDDVSELTDEDMEIIEKLVRTKEPVAVKQNKRAS